MPDANDLSTEDQEYNPTWVINEIRSYVAAWRSLPNPGDWGVSPTTQRLLLHWRHHEFAQQRPFFCQIEAVEMVIWLTEVSTRDRRHERIRKHLLGANEQSNPELFRIALKMATGSGKTTVMAMLIACDDGVLPHQSRLELAADETEMDEVYETERHLFYVACTRARDRLLISAVAPGSEFLHDL
jgi:hypothetical protein